MAKWERNTKSEQTEPGRTGLEPEQGERHRLGPNDQAPRVSMVVLADIDNAIHARPAFSPAEARARFTVTGRGTMFGEHRANRHFSAHSRSKRFRHRSGP